jgi:hypothetical protein
MNKLTVTRIALSGATALALGFGFIGNPGTSYAADADSVGYFQMRVGTLGSPEEDLSANEPTIGDPELDVATSALQDASSDGQEAAQTTQQNKIAVRGRVTGWF